jgi:hypothetical protein
MCIIYTQKYVYVCLLVCTACIYLCIYARHKYFSHDFNLNELRHSSKTQKNVSTQRDQKNSESDTAVTTRKMSSHNGNGIKELRHRHSSNNPSIFSNTEIKPVLNHQESFAFNASTDMNAAMAVIKADKKLTAWLSIRSIPETRVTPGPVRM